MNNKLSSRDHPQNLELASKLCLKSPKSKAAIISVFLVFLISYYDELKKPLISSILQNQTLRKTNFESTDVKVKPEIAWLLSFPNSGTSFTTALVRELTQTNTATNYQESNHPTPVLPDVEVSPMILRRNLPMPEKGYILTKTHCTR